LFTNTRHGDGEVGGEFFKVFSVAVFGECSGAFFSVVFVGAASVFTDTTSVVAVVLPKMDVPDNTQVFEEWAKNERIVDQ